MKKYKPVAVPKAAFAFCRYSVAILVWLSWIFRIKILLVLVFIILLWSAILKVGRAPMILIYKYTINRVVKSADEILDENDESVDSCYGFYGEKYAKQEGEAVLGALVAEETIKYARIQTNMAYIRALEA
jgi:hypothetical protein